MNQDIIKQMRIEYKTLEVLVGRLCYLWTGLFFMLS